MRKVETLATTYNAICSGEQPWVALGNFMNEWFDYSIRDRSMLIAEPIDIPMNASAEMVQWAAFCVASTEWLCVNYDIGRPAWVDEKDMCLIVPWFHAFHPENPGVRARLRACTPEPFARRNIFCGARVFANKYEFAARSKRFAEERLS